MSRLIFVIALFLICCKQRVSEISSEENIINKTIGVDFATSYDEGSSFIVPESISFFFQADPKELEKLDSIKIFNPVRNSVGFLRIISINYRDSILTSHFSARNYNSILGLSNKPKSVENVDSLYYNLRNLRYAIGNDTVKFNDQHDKVNFYFMNNDYSILYERNKKLIINGKGDILDTILLVPL